MTSVFPHRSEELEAYGNLILDMAERHPGPGFYDYHCQFSARASALLRYQNICIDWSVRDLGLYNDIFCGKPVNSCSHCSSTSHASMFCPNEPHAPMPRREHAQIRDYQGPRDRPDTSDLHGRPRVLIGNKEICNNFNGDSGCRAPHCPRVHACLTCKGEHAKPTCPLGKTPPPAKRVTTTVQPN